MHPKITINDRDSRIFSSRIVVPSENEIWAIKKNKGIDIKAIETFFHKFFLTGYDKSIQNNINANMSKKISESPKSFRGILVIIPTLFSLKKKNAQRVNQKRYPNYSFNRKHLLRGSTICKLQSLKNKKNTAS